MFDPSFFNFDFFGFALMASVVIQPLFGDVEKWLPDFGKWLGDGLKHCFDTAVAGIKGFIDIATKAISNAILSVREFLNGLWEHTKEFFKAVTDFFGEIWEWLRETISGFYEWLLSVFNEICKFLSESFNEACQFFSNTLESFWQLLSDTWKEFCEWLVSWFWWWLEYEFELALSYADWLVGFSHDILYKILEKLPPIQLPAAFEEGLTYFISYSMILNKIIPIKEGLMLLEVYITVYIALIVHGYVKGWYRWIGWFNK